MYQAETAATLQPASTRRASSDKPASATQPRSAPKTMKTFWTRVVGGDATKDQAKDTGMALVLVCLLFALARKKTGWVDVAILLHVINMIAPQVFRPAAVLWFGCSHVMGNIASRLIMAIVFFAVVTPIALWRRMMGADALQLKAFKAGRGSVMEERNHLFTGKDIEKPY